MRNFACGCTARLSSCGKRPTATFVFVTHDLQEAITLADRVVVLSRQPEMPKLILDINLPRPRDVVDIQANPAFGAYFKQLWAALDIQH